MFPIAPVWEGLGHSFFPRCQQVEKSKPWSGYHVHRMRVYFSSQNNNPSCSPPPLFSFRCARKEKCERSSEPRRFSSDIKQCVRLSVHPNNISVSQFSVTVSGWEWIHSSFLREEKLLTSVYHVINFLSKIVILI